HEDEVELLGNADMNYSTQMGRTYSLKPDILLNDKQELQLAGFSITVLHTPGHTAGGVCYYFPEYATVISGDTLFLGSVGRSDFPTGNATTLIESILSKLMILDDSVKVYPGHGESTTIGHERANNFYL
ncbi:MAG: MBL fold metallo-hydrolase, partial [Mobilitalea sp.]